MKVSDKKVFIVEDGNEEFAVQKMFEEEGWIRVEKLGEADLVQFVGGSDVSPELYGEKNTHSYCDPARDKYEQEIFNQTLWLKKPMAGICRGGQFLHVMNGGKMKQHITGHHGKHLVDVFVSNVVKTVVMTSDHHQAMKLSDKSVLLGSAKTDHTVEILFYSKTQCLCFQPHPEWTPKGSEERQIYFDLVKETIEG